MPTHHFTLIVDGADLQDESVVNSLFESGCDDALVGSTDGVQFIDFDRDAASLKAAVQSAVVDAERVEGIRVLRVANAGLTAMEDIAARTSNHVLRDDQARGAPGDKLSIDLLHDHRIQLRRKPGQPLSTIFGLLEQSHTERLSIEEIGEASAAGWGGEE